MREAALEAGLAQAAADAAKAAADDAAAAAARIAEAEAVSQAAAVATAARAQEAADAEATAARAAVETSAAAHTAAAMATAATKANEAEKVLAAKAASPETVGSTPVHATPTAKAVAPVMTTGPTDVRLRTVNAPPQSLPNCSCDGRLYLAKGLSHDEVVGSILGPDGSQDEGWNINEPVPADATCDG